MPPPSATMVIPTHNGVQRLGAPLTALSRQDAPPTSFEVIVIDNASTDRTATFASGHPALKALVANGCSCRVIREESLGLTSARIRGIQEALGEYVCFLDDDNYPAADFVSEGLKAFGEADVGVVTSRVFPRYEVPPPASIYRRQHLLAINDALGSQMRDFGTGATLAPTLGAGMWVRRSAFLSAVPWADPRRLLCDRAGTELTSGGDIELGYLIGKAGWRRIYWPGLVVWHEIPRERLALRYFTRLITGVVRSKATLERRYEGKTSSASRACGVLLRLMTAVVATPFLVLRQDGFREVVFVVAARWAEWLGPYRGSPGASR